MILIKYINIAIYVTMLLLTCIVVGKEIKKH